ncbi:hypothetical protein LCGC14_1407690 [marine sediment metagenome]|uniref:Uncharacterized protein n=1 Tax=marine sediment metagenome TaxID=412755 RepID=A0A0F9KG39_9ZZZZ
MLKWRCTNDLFSYCKGKPDWETEPHWAKGGDTPSEQNYLAGGVCKNTACSCLKLVKPSQMAAGG